MTCRGPSKSELRAAAAAAFWDPLLPLGASIKQVWLFEGLYVLKLVE